MIQLIILLLVLHHIGFFKKNNKVSFKLFYFFGAAIIIGNVFWVHSLSGSYFEGSDANYFYQEALLIAQNPSRIKLLDFRYIGYTIYQIIITYPYLENELFASVFIKLNSWTLCIISMHILNKRLVKAFEISLFSKRYIWTGVASMALWLSLYNFRDVIIYALLMQILAAYLSDKKIDKIWLLTALLLLMFFRYFYVAAIVVSFIIASISDTFSKQLKTQQLILFEILLLLFIIVSFDVFPSARLFVYEYQHLTMHAPTMAVQYDNLILKALTGMFAGNPLHASYMYFFSSGTRAWTITPISIIFQSYIYFLSYVFFIQAIFSTSYNLLYPLNKRYIGSSSYKNEDKKMWIIIRSCLYFIVIILLLYTSTHDGIQERIRTHLLFPASIIIVFFTNNKKYAGFFKIIFVMAIIISLVVFIVKI